MRLSQFFVACSLSLGLLATAQAGTVNGIKRVLLLSVDGLHALDLSNYTRNNPNSTLAQLSLAGVTYTNASSAKPSDSFPGLLAIVTGGSPAATGVFYDDSYDRTLSPPGSACSTVGTEVVYDESIDINPDALNAGGGINTAALPLNPSKGCTPVFPHSFLQVNTIFEVIKGAGGYTAWSDKHPAYELVNGPSGQGVDDLYTPEIAANGSIATSSVSECEKYDDRKVQAILNQINGKTSKGNQTAPVPTIFGMNFQAVSVGEKLNGYLDASATPSTELQNALDHTDQAVGKMVVQLKKQGLFASTLIIVTAKHGQSPIDPSKTLIIDNTLVPNLVNGVQSGLLAQATQDDIGMLWLTDQSQTSAAVAALAANQSQVGIQEILSGEGVKLMFNNPLQNSRTPDIIIKPNLGVIYTSLTSTKIAEHGGFSDLDTNVPILVALPGLQQSIIKQPVETTQIAPTILSALGLNPQALQAVQKEKTAVLPGLFP